MYHVRAQGIDERMINVHYYYLFFIYTKVKRYNFLKQFFSLPFDSFNLHKVKKV